MVENSMEGIFIVDDSYKFVYANRELSRILGYPLEEIINNDFRNFLDEESLNKVVGRYKKRQRGERVVPRYEFNIIKKSGEKRRLEMISTATRELRGGVKTIAQVLDITEQKKTIEKLKESEEKFKNLAEQSLISIIILQDDRVKYANQQFGKGIGYPLDEIRNWSLNELSQIVHPKDRDFVAEQARKKQKGMDDIVPKYEFRIITKDGDIVWRELYSNTITYQGKTADLITLVDISEKKISEQKLKESEKKFRGIFEAIPDIFFLITSDSTIIDYKGKKEDLFLPPESFLNKRMVDLLPESTAKVLCLKIKNAINSKEPQIMEYKLKLNEEIRNFEARILYYSEEQFAVFIRDITKRKKAEKILKEEVRRLREIDKIRRDLISRVSHELKTPIMAISGATELLDMYEKDLNQEGQGLIKMIQSNQKRLDHLINNLLDISRADYKQINLNLEKIDISSLIREITSEMNILKENRKISLKLDLPDTLYLDLDKLRIEQVIMNLLSNAIKNTPPKGEIKISVHQQNECVEIKVEDTGVGLTSEEMKKLFTKFGKIERYGEGLEYLDIRGSGLGLFISNEIIKLHEGSIRVHSPGRNKGSLFTIVLPKIKYK
ncbi:MAG: PAS domain-containing sensor histidine kinase [Candidatus Lokiarchaeota archaeon]